MDQNTHVMSRIERLEQADKDLADHLQGLAVQTERVAVATEVLSEAMVRQYEQNEKLSLLTQRVGLLEKTNNTLHKIGGIILTVGIGMIMYYLFGGA